jgi:hypothetical protein
MKAHWGDSNSIIPDALKAVEFVFSDWNFGVVYKRIKNFIENIAPNELSLLKLITSQK